ncbi:MAG: NFACT family protein [Clostridia bacterium]|nr:NFACT family protein [Clostridia bacterium]
MALDGAFIHCLRDELWQRLQDTRVDKIHQPSREELVFAMRGRNGSEKLYLSARVNSPRVQLIANSLENPATPPSLCMLLRKRLTGAWLRDIRQPGLERVLYFDFDAVNELGDTVRLTLAAELMGRHSNLILIGEQDRIVDAVKRVDLSMSPTRPVLPGAPYLPPPADADRRDALLHTAAQLADAALSSGLPLDKALQSKVQGFSPLICREIAQLAGEGDRARLEAVIEKFRAALQPDGRRVPYLVYRPDGTPLEFSFMPITQYGLNAVGREASSFSELLTDFYAEKDTAERMRRYAHDITRTVSTATERLVRKLDNQRRELAASVDRDRKRLYADLINANLHAIPKGAASVELMNYYDENCAMLTVPLDPSLSAGRNAQKYYKEYRKAKTAEEILQQQIARGEEELQYLDSVADALTRAADTRELEELRQELEQSGYLRAKKDKRRTAPQPTKPLTFVSDDGFTILVGRNNVQNDRLTTRTAKGSDWWFHTKNIPGSHTVVLTDGVEPPESTLRQAAVLAATHSKAAQSAQVPVDYTQIRHVKKPAGAKPGMVIYETNHTVYVTPDQRLAARLRKD